MPVKSDTKTKLVELGKTRFSEPSKQLVHFTGNNKIDEFLNDIEYYPHAYVLACLMDRQIKAERAWETPYKVCSTFETRKIEELASIAINEYVHLFETDVVFRFRIDAHTH